MTKTVAEILETKDGEEAFLFLVTDHEGTSIAPPNSQQLDALLEIAQPFFALYEEGGPPIILSKLSSDASRRTWLRATFAESGYSTLIELFANDAAKAHRPLIFESLLEHADDPGYIDELLSEHASKLSDEQKLKMLEKKNSLV